MTHECKDFWKLKNNIVYSLEHNIYILGLEAQSTVRIYHCPFCGINLEEEDFKASCALFIAEERRKLELLQKETRYKSFKDEQRRDGKFMISDRKYYCCGMMEESCNNKCDNSNHFDVYDCSDCIVVRNKDGTYGLPIHDGGSSYIRIDFCPWCREDLQDFELLNDND